MARRRVPIQHSDLVRRFAARLRDVRAARGMTQADLARQAQVTVAYVSRLEGAKVAPGIDLVERIAAALGTTVADLLPADVPPDPFPVLRDQARRLLDDLTRTGDRQAFEQLNPILALIAAAARHR